jgi:hypothetical protein
LFGQVAGVHRKRLLRRLLNRKASEWFETGLHLGYLVPPEVPPLGG